jgi:16S rRNA processing protein RimM
MAPSPKKSSDLQSLPGSGRGEDEVELGFISGIFGVHGEVRVHLHNRESTLLNRDRLVVLIDAQGHRYQAKIRCRSGAGKRILGRIEGVVGRERAATLKDWKIAVSSDVLPPLAEGEFYVWRVVGLPAMVDGQKVGVVAAVHESGPLDIFEIHADGGVFFVPALHENITVDVEGGRVILAADALVEG